MGDLVALLRGDEGGKGMFQSYPVVAGLDGMAFVGTISRKDLVSHSLVIIHCVDKMIIPDAVDCESRLDHLHLSFSFMLLLAHLELQGIFFCVFFGLSVGLLTCSGVPLFFCMNRCTLC